MKFSTRKELVVVLMNIDYLLSLSITCSQSTWFTHLYVHTHVDSTGTFVMLPADTFVMPLYLWTSISEPLWYAPYWHFRYASLSLNILASLLRPWKDGDGDFDIDDMKILLNRFIEVSSQLLADTQRRHSSTDTKVSAGITAHTEDTPRLILASVL